MTKFCIEVKKTLSKVYYEVKYFYNYYFKSSNTHATHQYNYVPLQEVVVDSQPVNNKNIPRVYSNPPSFNEPEPEPVSQSIVTEPYPNIGYTVNIRRRPSHEYTSTTEKVLTPISEKSDSEHELDINITVTETDARCELDSDDNWEILDSKND